MRLLCFLFVLLTFMSFSCGNLGTVPKPGEQDGDVSSSTSTDPGEQDGDVSSSTSTDPEETAQAATVTLAANPLSLTVNGQSVISATVLDSSNANMPDGTVVSFSLSSSVLGTINQQSTTANGIALATFTAASTAGTGTVTVTATSGIASSTVNIAITAQDLGSIEFVSATPSIIGISGSGQPETSTIKFLVKDTNGNPAADGVQVSFSMSGPNGGENLTQTTASTGTGNGEVTTILNSGLVAGIVEVIATVTIDGSPKSSSATPISIGGGPPNNTHLTIATDKWNLEGLGWVNIQANISVFMADRFGNQNILQGTAVSFQTESGAINTGNTTTPDTAVIDSLGSATVVFRTQNPPPASPDHPEGKDVAVLGGGVCAGAPSAWDTYPADWESCLQSYVLATYGITTTRHPRDGWANIIVSTRGEEGFDDSNGNGMFDAGESFTDTFQDPFIDLNDNNVHDDGTGTDPFELYKDDNGDGNYDGLNGSWDSNKTIFQDITLLITGIPAHISANPSTFAVGNGGAQAFTLLVTDRNLNPLIGDSSVSITAEKGELTGDTSYTFPDLFHRGPIELNFTLSDDDPLDTDPVESTVIEIVVTHKEAEYSITISGTID